MQQVKTVIRRLNKVHIRIDLEEYANLWIVRLFQSYVAPAALYLLAAAVIGLNVRLMFDNVLWGDEAFSANTIKTYWAGILEISYYADNHPPLYYYWAKVCAQLFGYTVPVYHLASLIPFILGILFAVTILREHYGKLPAALFVMISGLGSSCLEYNQEVRMYSLAFFFILLAYYSSSRVMSGKRGAWAGMVLFGIAAAYTHYYGLVTAGLLIFVTGAVYWLRYRGKTWRRGLAALVLFIAAYLPWLRFLFHSMSTEGRNWWNTEVLAFRDSLKMLFGTAGMCRPLALLFLILLMIILAAESSFFHAQKKEGETYVRIGVPSVKGWSDQTWSLMIGLVTVAGVLIFAYLLCALYAAILAQRYLYPTSAIVFLMLVMECSRGLELCADLSEKSGKEFMERLGKGALLLFLAVLLVIGIRNYGTWSTKVNEEKTATEATLTLIGDPDPDTVLVNSGVTHLGWTVLSYYYPDNEVENAGYQDIEADRYWYFTSTWLTEDDFNALTEAGYVLYGYGEQQISKYTFVLYYFER
ncbi:MAG: glycosyltransferase family 39 protein [Lachnospiraceae bacterium]|nr:glycosyltransferase family 39 protein [Lachnospiraceae bacterium]